MCDVLMTECRRFVADHYHSLPGFCEPRHGHNWELEATVRDNGAPSQLPPLLDAWIKKVDYSLLNEQTPLAGRNPTAEALAEWLFQYLETSSLSPVLVRIKEKPGYWAACSTSDERAQGSTDCYARLIITL